MPTTTRIVPLVDPDTNRFPDEYAPPSVAIDAATATTKAAEAVTAAGEATTGATTATEAAGVASGHATTATTAAGNAAGSASTAVTAAAQAVAVGDAQPGAIADLVTTPGVVQTALNTQIVAEGTKEFVTVTGGNLTLDGVVVPVGADDADIGALVDNPASATGGAVAGKISSSLTAANIPGQVSAAVAAAPTVTAAAASAVSEALVDASVAPAMELSDDEFTVQFRNEDDSLSLPFIQANEADGIHDTKITHLPGSIPQEALDPDVSLPDPHFRTLSDDQGWRYAVQYQDGEVQSGVRMDGTVFPPAVDLTTKRPLLVMGDSLTEAWTALGMAGLAALLGRVVTMQGISGQPSTKIAARYGSSPSRITVTGGVIPASGSVAVSATVPLGASSYAGVLAGVPGLLSTTNDDDNTTAETGTFTRTSPGLPVKVNPGTPFLRNFARRSDSLIWFTNRNNWRYAGQKAEALTHDAEMMSYVGDRSQVLIFGILPWVGEELGTAARVILDDVNEARRAQFPREFEDVGLMMRSVEVLASVGITATATDIQNITDGLTPESLRIDAGHLNAKGYEVLNAIVLRLTTSREWK